MKGQTLKLAVIATLILGAFYFLSGPGQAQYGITIPKIKALYEDNLQGKITSSATSMTLVRGTDKQERNLSGTYGFVIDEGSTIEEFVICSASGTALTNCLRGIDVENGKSEVATLKEEHRRGASVKISNYPQLAIISRILNGDEDLPNLLTYTNQEIGRDSSATSTAIMDKGYMDSLAISGSPTSTYFQIGMVMLASRTQTASTTASSTTGAPLVLPAASSSSTPNLRFKGIVPVTEDDGYLSQLWLDLTEDFDLFGSWDFTGQTIGSATTTLSATTTVMFDARGALVPVGTILLYTATSSPEGWLLADGTAILRSDFSDLFDVIGTAFGDGDGSTTFNLPNMTQRVPLGLDVDAVDGEGDVLGKTGGATSTTQTIDNLVAHTHPIDTVSGSNNGNGPDILESGTSRTDTASYASESTGGGDAFAILDPYLTVNYIIKY